MKREEGGDFICVYLFIFQSRNLFFHCLSLPIAIQRKKLQRRRRNTSDLLFSFFSTFSNLFITLFYYLELLSVFCLNGKKDEKKEERKTKFRIQTKIKYDTYHPKFTAGFWFYCRLPQNLQNFLDDCNHCRFSPPRLSFFSSGRSSKRYFA